MKTLKKLLYHSNACSAVVLLAFILTACRHTSKPPEKDIVKQVEQLEERTGDNLKALLDYAGKNQSSITDAVKLHAIALVSQVYVANDYAPVWSKEDHWEPVADSLFRFIGHAKEYGLFPGDYHDSIIKVIRARISADPASRKNAALWAKAEALFTDAYFQLARDLKLGRLAPDSITVRRVLQYNDNYFLQYFNKALGNKNIIASLNMLEPAYPQYAAIRQEIKSFIDTADFSARTYLMYPAQDSLNFIGLLARRLSEDGLADVNGKPTDSMQLAESIKKYQHAKGMKKTGIISATLVKSLNNTDVEKFKTIALTLDSYKQLPDTLPATYLLVNIPAYMLYVYNGDTLVFDSKVITGSPKTKTPLLNGRVTNFITYPQWTVPYSIIFKDMLPKIQRDADYLRKQNLMVVDNNDNVLDPASINWMQLSDKHFPYLIRQKEGDDNSLGVIKFNFANKYNVYLHDTNARSLFGRSRRALSHGCVRVQQWEALSHFLVRADTARYPVDSLDEWMLRREKHVVTGFPRVPVFIRYFLVEAGDGNLRFYDDVYGYGSVLRQRYFAGKKLD